MRFHRTAEELRADRHAWMIDHDTGAINEREIAKRALAGVRASMAACGVTSGLEDRWQRAKDGLMSSAEHIAWEWRKAHGDFSDTHLLADVEIKGLSGPVRSPWSVA